MRHAIVDPKTMEVVNVVIWEGAEWLPPRGHLVIANESVGIGDVYIEEKGVFVKPDLEVK